MGIDLQAVLESARRSVETYNSLLPSKEKREFLAKTATDAVKALEPTLRMMRDPVFQRQLQEITRAAGQVSDIVQKSHSLTLPAIRAMEELYRTVDTASVAIAPLYEVPETKREEVIVRPIFAETKLQIRRGIPAIKEIWPLKLPADTTWESVQMRFVDPHNLFIEILKHKVKITVDYHDMGMWDGRTNLPDTKWLMLRGLAKYGGEISWETPIASDKLKKHKQLLAEALKLYFNIDGDPFMLYQKEKAYRLKMILFPDEPITPQNNDGLGIEEYLDAMTPEVFDPYENEP
jgi:hypothetical protein